MSSILASLNLTDYDLSDLELLLQPNSMCNLADQTTTSCSVEVDAHTGTAEVVATLNPCATPARLDMAVQIPRHGHWEFNFLAGNPPEARQIGSRLWPVALRVDFGNVQTSTSGDSGSLTACFETLRTGDRTCFLEHQGNELPTCATGLIRQNLDGLFASGLLGLSLLLTLLTFLIIGLTLWHRAKNRRKLYKRHEDSQSFSNESGVFVAPPLPGAKSHPTTEILPPRRTGSIRRGSGCSSESGGGTKLLLDGADQDHSDHTGPSLNPNRMSIPPSSSSYCHNHRDSLYVIEELSVELNMSDPETSGSPQSDHNNTRTRTQTMTLTKEVQTSVTSLDEGIASSASNDGKCSTSTGSGETEGVRESPV